jgi:hypothetical protein
MSLSTVLFFFLAHLGIGIAWSLTFVSHEAGVKFFRFNAGLSAILVAFALAFRLAALDGAPAESLLTQFAVSTLYAVDAALVIYWATVGRVLARVRPAIIGVSIAGGLVVVILQGIDASAGGVLPMQVLTVVSFISSAALLGGACTAMTLGHWYLVIPSMQVTHLQSIVKVHIASTIARVVVVVAAVWFAIATWQAESGAPSFRHYIMSVDGVFFWQRVLFGLFGPAVLSYLTWETAKIRATQSATGILYVDFFTVMVGEVLAKYIVLATHVPV